MSAPAPRQAATACRYCGRLFAKLNLPFHSRRVTCGGEECKTKYNTDFQRAKRERQGSGEGTNVEAAWRTQGEFRVPSKQGRLDKAMDGQLLHCPACGREHAASTVDQRIDCPCGALWTLSVGRRQDGDVAVVRMDRWR